MKSRITRNDLKNSGKLIIKVPYCVWYPVLGDFAKYYNSGVYGWNYDAFEFDDAIIVTGYRLIGVPGVWCNSKLDNPILKKLEKDIKATKFDWRIIELLKKQALRDLIANYKEGV